MRKVLTMIIACTVVLMVLARVVYAQASEEIRDYYDDGRCTCETNKEISDGILVLHRPNEDIGYAWYRSNLSTVNEVIMHTSLVIGNNSKVLIWVTPVSVDLGSLGPLLDPIKEGRVIPKGIAVLITPNMYSIMVGVTDDPNTAFTYPSIIANGHLDESKYKYVSIQLSRVSENTAHLEISIDDSTVYVSDKPFKMVPFYEPKNVYFVSYSSSATELTGIDYTIIMFRSTSSKMAKLPEIQIQILRLTPSIGIFIHNQTHLVISYSCYYHERVDECHTYIVTLFDRDTGEIIDEVEIGLETAREYISNVLLCSKLVNIGNASNIDIEVFNVVTGETMYGSISIPKPSIMGENVFTSMILSILPVSVVVALAVRTGSMQMVGVGLISSGVIVILLPWIGVIFPYIYAMGILLIMFGILVLINYRS